MNQNSTIMNDTDFMKMALALAQKGLGHTSPNPMVGALVVKNGRVVGQGWHQRAGGAHAEVNAIDDAGDLARGACLYVTLEPCNHFGKTPPCTRKILDAGIRRVVAAMADPNPHVTGGGFDWLTQQGIAVDIGVCQDRAKQLNEAFIKHSTTGRPFVLAKCAATLDGQIATRSGSSQWITGAAARQVAHRLRQWADAILVGSATVAHDNPSLTTRLDSGPGSNPVPIVLDTRLRLSHDLKVMRPGTIVVSQKQPSTQVCARLAEKGITVLEMPLVHGRIDLDALMAHLGARGFNSVLIEGGGAVIGSALSAGIVDKIAFFYAPKLLGGHDGVPICSGRGPARIDDCVVVDQMRMQAVGEDIMVEGYLSYPDQEAAGN